MDILNQPPPNTWIIQLGFGVIFLLLGIPIGIWVNLWSNRIQDRKNAQKTKSLEKSRETQFAANQWAISYASNIGQLLAAQGRYNELRNKELVWRLLGRAFATLASIYITSMTVIIMKDGVVGVTDVIF